jgi:hypothetical protein
MYGSNIPTIPKFNFVGKSDFDAGLLFLSALSRLHPDLNWSDLANPQFMGRTWLERQLSTIGDVTGSTVKGVGNVLADTSNFIASKGGDIVRLATDPKVAGTLAAGVSAYVTGGLSAVGGSIMDYFKQTGVMTEGGTQVVTAAGASAKKNLSINWTSPWILGGGAVAGLGLAYLIFRKK